jgi:hypothetical protein
MRPQDRSPRTANDKQIWTGSWISSRLRHFLSVENGLLLVRIEGEGKDRIPVAYIAAVSSSYQGVVFTQHALAEWGRSCEARLLPCSMLLPLQAHYAQTERFHAQSVAPVPVKTRIWKELVHTKLDMQDSMLLD